MRCDDADALLAADAVGSLDPSERPRLEHHLHQCAPCREEAAAYGDTVARLPIALEPSTPPECLRTRLLATVYAEAAGRAEPAREPWPRRLWQRIPATRGLTVVGAIAGGAAVIAGGWALLSGHLFPSRSTASVAMSGTLAQPRARAMLSWDRDTQNAVLMADGLSTEPAAAPPGPPTYEVWLISADGRPQAAAYLTAAPLNGAWTAAFQSDIHRFRAVAVTLEATTGRVVPAGTEVLRADLSSIP